MSRHRPKARPALGPLAATALVVASGLFVACAIAPAVASEVSVPTLAQPRRVTTGPTLHAPVHVSGALRAKRPTPAREAASSSSATEPTLLARKAARLAPPSWLLALGTVSVPASTRQIALTFDDGPSKNTTAVLQVLARYHARATFFCIGVRAQGKTEKLRSILAEGSEIGNHTYRHVSLIGHGLTWDEAQIARAQHVLEAEVGVRPVWVRPEGGWLDQTGVDAILALHTRYAYWNDPGEDTVKGFTAQMIAAKVLEHARPGAIIVLHETNPDSVEALPHILHVLRSRGYTVTSLTDAFAR